MRAVGSFPASGSGQRLDKAGLPPTMEIPDDA